MIKEKPTSNDSNEVNIENIDLERLTDIEVANKLREHIENPCGAEVSAEAMEEVRGNYIKLANEAIENFTNPYAKDLLKMIINKYKKE